MSADSDRQIYWSIMAFFALLYLACTIILLDAILSAHCNQRANTITSTPTPSLEYHADVMTPEGKYLSWDCRPFDTWRERDEYNRTHPRATATPTPTPTRVTYIDVGATPTPIRY